MDNATVLFEKDELTLLDLSEVREGMRSEFMFKPCCSALTSTSCKCSSSSVLTTCSWSNNDGCNAGCKCD